MEEIKQKVYFSDELEAKLKKGINTLADAVKTTMGPKGKLVLIQKKFAHPSITKDGVTVANAINLPDEVENLGAKVIKEAANRTAEEAGDGTTTATVLAQAIYNEGLKMKAAGYQVDQLKTGIELAMIDSISFLESMKKDITDKEELKQVAIISANGEIDTAELIVEAISASGVDGSVIVEQAKGFKSELTVVDGYNINRGYLSPYFVSDKNKMTCEYSNPLILIADREFNSIHEVMKPLEIALEKNKPILIIANEIAGDALQGIVLNRTKGSLRICAIKSPGFNIARHDMLIDMSALLGGSVITNSFDMNDFSENDFATCEKVIIGRSSTLFVSKDKKQNDAVVSRMTSIKQQLEGSYALTDGEIKTLKYRLKQLCGKISILRVGAATESELIERYDRVDDALNATKAALEEGILPGGGIALVKCKKILMEKTTSIDDASIKAGYEIVMRAILEPFRQIIRNGNEAHEAILEKVLATDNADGYDARNKKIGNMYDLGILDPFKVVRCALENAVSCSLMLLNVECCLINIE
jgi:chaperonin GroEL